MDNRYAFIQLIRLGIGHRSSLFSVDVNWDEVEAIAKRQGLSAIIVDGIDRLPDTQRPPKEKLLQMIGQVVQGYEYRYELYRRAIADLAASYNIHGYKMMILKGYACSLDWPKPEHRPCGDIDIWQFGYQKEADGILAKEKGVIIDSSEQHHTIFQWCGFMVENHYDFLDVFHHKSNATLEKLLKKLGKDDTYSQELFGERVYLPSPNLHALFLLRHMMSHFAATEITLRHILDWAFFVEKNEKNVDWGWLNKILNEYGMIRMFNLINTICVDDLGFSYSLLPLGDVDLEQKNRVLEEIINPANVGIMPNNVIRRVIWKYRRWRANAWKHDLCYSDSMWSAFWRGVWGHLIKPKSI